MSKSKDKDAIGTHAIPDSPEPAAPPAPAAKKAADPRVASVRQQLIDLGKTNLDRDQLLTQIGQIADDLGKDDEPKS